MEDWQKRDKALLDLYLKSLHEVAGVKYAWAFRVCMDEKYQTLYYLIHATNHSRFVESQYRQALKELENEGKIKVERITSKRTGLRGKDKIIFPKSNPIQAALVDTHKTVLRIPKIKIHYKEYILLDGTKKILASKVNDGSIIKRFDKTPIPRRKTDVVCPHFIELKWAYGCPFDCAWCYLKGTFRFRPEGKSPEVKPYDKIKLHTEAFLNEVKEPEILNTGEIADSLMYEKAPLPFSKFIIPIFEKQDKHKVLFLSKSSNVKNLLEIEPHNQVIVSFSLNAIPVAERWEKASHVLKRIEAARKVFGAGYEVRIRIDPMIPIENWQKYYLELLCIIFDNLTPERITLGSLRGLQSTINGCTVFFLRKVFRRLLVPKINKVSIGNASGEAVSLILLNKSSSISLAL